MTQNNLKLANAPDIIVTKELNKNNINNKNEKFLINNSIVFLLSSVHCKFYLILNHPTVTVNLFIDEISSKIFDLL